MIALIAPNTKPPTVTSTIKITTKRVSFSNPVFFRCPLSPKATHVTSFTEYIVKSILTRNVLFRKLQTVSLNISLLINISLLNRFHISLCFIRVYDKL